MEGVRKYILSFLDAISNTRATFYIFWYHIYGPTKAFDMKYTEL